MSHAFSSLTLVLQGRDSVSDNGWDPNFLTKVVFGDDSGTPAYQTNEHYTTSDNRESPPL